MKITIDTKKDTHEDIKKVLNILTHILNQKDSFTEKLTEKFTEKSAEVDATSMMSMFADPEPKKITEPEDKAPDFSSFLNLTRKEEEKKDTPEIQFF